MNYKKIEEICFAVIIVSEILGLCLGLANIWGRMENVKIAINLYYSLMLIFIASMLVFRIARKLSLSDNQVIRFIQD